MDEQQLQEARWRESLELLGLVETPRSTPAVSPSTREANHPGEPVPQPSVKREEPLPAEDLDVAPEEESLQSETMEEVIESEELAQADESALPEEPESPDESPTPEAAPGEEDKPRRGRRRRRRGRRRGGADKREEGAVIADDPQRPQLAEREPSGRPTATPRPPANDRELDLNEPLEEESTSVEIEDSEMPQEMARLTPEELDTLADWDVPSWQDLISSLYRPDR